MDRSRLPNPNRCRPRRGHRRSQPPTPTTRRSNHATRRPRHRHPRHPHRHVRRNGEPLLIPNPALSNTPLALLCPSRGRPLRHCHRQHPRRFWSHWARNPTGRPAGRHNKDRHCRNRSQRALNPLITFTCVFFFLAEMSPPRS